MIHNSISLIEFGPPMSYRCSFVLPNKMFSNHDGKEIPIILFKQIIKGGPL